MIGERISGWRKKADGRLREKEEGKILKKKEKLEQDEGRA